MKKIFKYVLGVLSFFNMLTVYAVDKFEILPDLPDPLAYAVQPAEAAAVKGASELNTLTTQSIGSEPSVISVLISLAIVILLIYVTGIVYAKLNRVGFKTMKRQHADLARSQVSVVSTTQLGNNKTLHVVELDGKRMLIGASSSAIQLIKDLGSFSEGGSNEEFSHIEIPNIKIPKIEIPKIEIPNINFSKLVTKTHKPINEVEKNEDIVTESEEKQDFSPILEKENSEVIIDSLFTQQTESIPEIDENTKSEHIVDPDDFALYKKYLG